MKKKEEKRNSGWEMEGCEERMRNQMRKNKGEREWKKKCLGKHDINGKVSQTR